MQHGGPIHCRPLVSTVRHCASRLPDELAANTRLKIVDLSGCPLRSPTDLQASPFRLSQHPRHHLVCIHAGLRLTSRASSGQA